MLAATARSDRTGPRLTTTVAREYVHRAALAEVFLTGWHEESPDAFTVTAQWPRFHSFYADEGARYDPMLLCETIRQTFPLLAHAAYGMPLGHALSWSRFRYSLDPRELAIRERPAELDLRVRCHDIRYRGSVPTRMSMSAEVYRDGRLTAVTGTSFGCHSRAVYERLRRGRTDAGALMQTAAASLVHGGEAPALTGRTRPRDVVVTPADPQGGRSLRIDTGHPIFFDHPLDHAPGMLVLEAIRQCAHTELPETSPAMVTRMDTTFNQYVELDSPCRLHVSTTATDRTGTTVRVEAAQNGRTAFSATADVALLPAPGAGLYG
jgi:2-oxo-3-(phosphooxy)propyl 3-oxoalkanoate synthase